MTMTKNEYQVLRDVCKERDNLKAENIKLRTERDDLKDEILGLMTECGIASKVNSKLRCDRDECEEKLSKEIEKLSEEIKKYKRTIQRVRHLFDSVSKIQRKFTWAYSSAVQVKESVDSILSDLK